MTHDRLKAHNREDQAEAKHRVRNDQAHEVTHCTVRNGRTAQEGNAARSCSSRAPSIYEATNGNGGRDRKNREGQRQKAELFNRSVET
jgi:hypothetical protein